MTAAAGVAVGAAQRDLAELTAAGIIRREVEGRQVYFRANASCPVFAELQSILRKTAVRLDAAAAATKPGQNPSTSSKSSATRPAVPRGLTPPNPAFVWMTRR